MQRFVLKVISVLSFSTQKFLPIHVKLLLFLLQSLPYLLGWIKTYIFLQEIKIVDLMNAFEKFPSLSGSWVKTAYTLCSKSQIKELWLCSRVNLN